MEFCLEVFPRDEDGILPLRRLTGLFRGGLHEVEAGQAELLCIAVRLEVLPEFRLAPGAVAGGAQTVVQQKSVEVALFDADGKDLFQILEILFLRKAGHPAVVEGVVVDVGDGGAVRAFGRPVLHVVDLVFHVLEVEGAELDVGKGPDPVFAAVSGKFPHPGKVLLFELPAHPLVEAAQKVIQPQRGHLLHVLFAVEIRVPLLRPQCAALQAGRPEPASPQEHGHGFVASVGPDGVS